MVKVRMTTADVAAEVRCLRRLIGMRCANIYDLSPKTYVIKFAKSSGVAESGESERALVLLESGVRLHTTEFSRDKSSTPSGFTLKLRKHLRTRRLEDVRQLGIDRVVDFQFGLGEGAFHIILELYSQGNLLLTDSHHNVITLLRTHRDDEKGLLMMAHHQYPINSCRLFERTKKEAISTLLKEQTRLKADEAVEEQQAASKEVHTGSVNEDAKKTKWKPEGKGSKSASQEVSGNGKKGAGLPTLKFLLVEGLGYGPSLSEHIILSAGLQPGLKMNSSILSRDEFEALAAAIKRFEDWLEAVVSGDIVPEGYIYMQKVGMGKAKSAASDVKEEFDRVYDEFSPLDLKQMKDRESMKLATFDAAMDEYYSKVEGQRADQQRRTQEESALTKLDKIRADQTNRVKALKREVDQSVHMAELIEYNLDDVDAAILAVRTALASGMDWKDLGRMIKEEKKAGNPVAGVIHSLQLETNQITLLLSNNLDDMDEEEKTRPVDKVEVDLSLSAHANARRWFEMKKKHATKQEKTLAAHEKAFKAAEKKTQQQLAQAKTVAAITHIRKMHWFEKFNWFISSENYLVISGRDAQQNELVVKRYMKKGDLYVHADLHGASSTVIKNNDPTRPIPPFTINQAGSFTVCRSQAWDSKIVTSAWWVHPHQVSKTAPTGEYLTVGSFMVRGKKNFLAPNPLVMGYGLLFRLDESCIAAHLNERRIRGDGEGEESERAAFVEAGHPEVGKSSNRNNDDDEENIEVPSEDQDQEVRADTSDNDDEGFQEKSRSGSDRSDGMGSELMTAVHGTNISEGGDDSGFDALLDKAFELRSAHKVTSNKYGLELVNVATDADRNVDSAPGNVKMSKAVQREKPYVSRAERRKLKKGSKHGKDDERNGVAGDEELATVEGQERLDNLDISDELSALGTVEGGPDSSPGGSKPSRGRKGKLKKIKEKYAEQDEEERQLRMSLLASAGRKESKQPKALGVNGKASTSSKTTFNEQDAGLKEKVCYKCKKTGHIVRDCPYETASLSAKDERPTYVGDSQNLATERIQKASTDDDAREGIMQPIVRNEAEKPKDGLSRRAYSKAAKEEIAAIMAEENVVELGDDDKEKLIELDSLTGIPHSSDVLLYSVPMCGPYSALQAFKYRVKLTPGPAKKGKAAKVAIDVFSHMPETTVREKELMKAVTDPELVACMLGNAKVTAPGLTKLKKTQKKWKKVASKEVG
ncbi:nuclear export mediator factor NEMF [Marchantia polymorpha subsp. ruderalis]|uniref:CCHC-type domain-containing protein n=2 Tax=Marchantia polymorpha TaxID=3197 RepID=A0AAF6AK46_MARPO|nr:hypothetical protein MARPO_0029s0152 [Marchantia polymorpha]BBM96816.1 hypothetical protein Mp_1g00940 [Marchantia polymorpha subsp. ruderalis]|eukprot:PTQ42667.1 hypothetical protein MARPO_0029s0152 [Marchantia polymorpha]